MAFRVLFAIAAFWNLDMQMDVQTVFLYGITKQLPLVIMPRGYEKKGIVCKSNKAYMF